MIEKLSFEMTKDQLEKVEQFIIAKNECICKKEIKEGQKRCLFAIPVSSKMKSYVSVEGNWDVIAICEECFRRVNSEIIRIKNEALQEESK